MYGMQLWNEKYVWEDEVNNINATITNTSNLTVTSPFRKFLTPTKSLPLGNLKKSARIRICLVMGLLSYSSGPGKSIVEHLSRIGERRVSHDSKRRYVIRRRFLGHVWVPYLPTFVDIFHGVEVLSDEECEDLLASWTYNTNKIDLLVFRNISWM